MGSLYPGLRPRGGLLTASAGVSNVRYPRRNSGDPRGSFFRSSSGFDNGSIRVDVPPPQGVGAQGTKRLPVYGERVRTGKEEAYKLRRVFGRLAGLEAASP